jgi:hypothetical protein
MIFPLLSMLATGTSRPIFIIIVPSSYPITTLHKLRHCVSLNQPFEGKKISSMKGSQCFIERKLSNKQLHRQIILLSQHMGTGYRNKKYAKYYFQQTIEKEMWKIQHMQHD